jgi:hypothetical protein
MNCAEQATTGFRYLGNGSFESGLVGFRGLMETAYFTHELQGSRVNFFRCGELFNVP